MSTGAHVHTEHGMEAVAWRVGRAAVEALVPALSYEKRKGQAGRVGVVGGSAEYTGAPYYAAAAALQVGADLSFVFTAEEAATAIKCYSPELIVIPSYKAEQDDEAVADALAASVEPWLDRLHGLVVGPGLGRREGVLNGVARILEKSARRMPVVVDADGLYLVTRRPDLVAGCSNVILTPNAGEFDRLERRLLGDGCSSSSSLSSSQRKNRNGAPARVAEAKALLDVCKALRGPTVVKKGRVDLISDGRAILAVDETASPRRCGGIGDILAGSLGVLAVWARDLDLDDDADRPAALDVTGMPDLPDAPPRLWAAYAACVLARRAAAAAFARKRRSMTAPDVLAEVGAGFEDMCPTVVLDGDGGSDFPTSQGGDHTC